MNILFAIFFTILGNVACQSVFNVNTSTTSQKPIILDKIQLSLRTDNFTTSTITPSTELIGTIFFTSTSATTLPATRATRTTMQTTATTEVTDAPAVAIVIPATPVIPIIVESTIPAAPAVIVAKVDHPKRDPVIAMLGSKTFIDIMSPKIMTQRDASDQLIPRLLTDGVKNQIDALNAPLLQADSPPSYAGPSQSYQSPTMGGTYPGAYGNVMTGLPSQPVPSYYPNAGQMVVQG